MSAVPPLYKVFEELSTDGRFGGLELELRRIVNSIPPLPRYDIHVTNVLPRGDVAAYATLIAALGEFAREHNLDTELSPSSVTLSPRG